MEDRCRISPHTLMMLKSVGMKCELYYAPMQTPYPMLRNRSSLTIGTAGSTSFLPSGPSFSMRARPLPYDVLEGENAEDMFYNDDDSVDDTLENGNGESGLYNAYRSEVDRIRPASATYIDASGGRHLEARRKLVTPPARQPR